MSSVAPRIAAPIGARRERLDTGERGERIGEAAGEVGDKELAELAATWGRRPGIYGYLADVRQTTIAARFIVTAFVFFLLGGVLALLIRAQLARPDSGLMGPDLYNQVFSMHGSTMMFLFAVPVMQGMGLYLVPLMIGTRTVAFPRLNAFSYWVYVIGGALLYVAFFLNTGPEAGWFSYVPLASSQFSAGKRGDVWSQMITFTELSALASAVNMIATIFKMRAPGMSLNRMPLFVWAMLVTSFMVVFAMPAVMVSSTWLTMDRLIGTHMFNASEGGDPLLWQHLFWFFGHPEVYIIFIPALGMLSSIIVSHCRRPIVGYLPMVLSLVATGFIGFGLWVHHMFATGLPQMGQSFFTAASMIIAIPTGVQIFCWIATLWSGYPRVRTPLLFAIGFLTIFVIGGLTGVMLASVPLDLQVHDTFFVVAHLHYVLIGGAIFPLFGAFYYWLPKATGRMLSERAGRVNFALLFVGFNLTFFPMHMLGLKGMPRRVYTYAAEMGWGELNLLATLGAAILALGVLVFLGNVAWSLKRGAFAGRNPWGADTLEWATASPPPSYNFEKLPTVRGQYALWTARPDQPYVAGLRADVQELLITRILDAAPDHKIELPGPSIWPLLLALAVGVAFIGFIFTPWSFLAGGVLGAAALIGWVWPKGRPKELLEEGEP